MNSKDLMRSNVEDDFKLGAILAERSGLLEEIKYETEDPEIWEKVLPLELLRKVQEEYPNTFIAGSLGLFLHGVRLSRWKEFYPKAQSNTAYQYMADLDVISPYYINLEHNSNLNTGKAESYNSSGADFTEYVLSTQTKSAKKFPNNTIEVGVKIELRVNPTEKYEIIEYNNYKYRVSKLQTIIKEKVKYCFEGGNYQKHISDFEDICGKTYYKEYLKKKNEVK